MTALAALPELATPAELGAYLGKTPKTLANWRSRGIGPRATRLPGRRVVYRRAEVESWLKASTY